MEREKVKVLAAGAAVVAAIGLVVGLGALGVSAAHSGMTAPAPVAAAAPLPTVQPAAAVATSTPAPTSTTTPPTTTTTSTTPTTTTTTAAPATVAGIPCSLPAVGDGACVQLSKQRAWLVSDGKIVQSVSVKTGKSGSTTPVGRFSVLYKDIDHKSKEFDDAPMPYSVFFYPGDAFHTGSLVERSNGCVHLSNSAAKAFYNTLQNGDPVQVVR